MGLGTGFPASVGIGAGFCLTAGLILITLCLFLKKRLKFAKSDFNLKTVFETNVEINTSLNKLKARSAKEKKMI